MLLFLATLSWSFVGILVKTASHMVDSTTVTFARFFIGVLFLGLFLLVKHGSIRLRFDLRWIWIGAIGKCCNYLFENLALTIGYSYGNILVGPIQTTFLLLVTAFVFKERVSSRGWIAAALCICGVLLISWNGQSLASLAGGGMWITLLFVIAGIGASFHVLSQKLLAKDMDAGSMNFSVFLWASVITAVPVPFQFHMTGDAALWPILSLVALGLITGLSFYWFSQALQLVSFPVAVIVSNSGVLFSILWSHLFFHDPITRYIIGGVLLFTVGLLLLNLPSRSRHQAAKATKPGQAFGNR